MKNIINIIFPVKLHLNILQLEEYRYWRFTKWILKNFALRSVHTKKPLIITSKIKQIFIIYLLSGLLLLVFVQSSTNNFLLALLAGILYLTQPFIGIAIALLVIKPYEIVNKHLIIERTRKKILSMKNLKVIGITGSYGKTSTKEILYQLLKNKYRVLRTPESYNTIFGVAKVVDLELDQNYDFFICEMAAYTEGEIKNLCYMVPPDFGILTGITSQHLERFGNLKNIIKAKFELFDAIKDKSKIVMNLDNKHIKNELTQRNIKIKTIYKNSSLKFQNNLTKFTISDKNKNYTVSTKLFGYSQVTNITLAASMAKVVGMDIEKIIEEIPKVSPFNNRLVLKPFDGGYILDNTYSSNIESFKENIKTARELNGKKVIVTPGIVELGNKESSIHKQIGSLSKEVFSEAILVGKDKRTISFAEGFGNNASFIDDSREAYSKTIDKLKKEYDWIFLENDVTQNY